jgi:hypothetical protein
MAFCSTPISHHITIKFISRCLREDPACWQRPKGERLAARPRSTSAGAPHEPRQPMEVINNGLEYAIYASVITYTIPVVALRWS